MEYYLTFTEGTDRKVVVNFVGTDVKFVFPITSKITDVVKFATEYARNN